MPLPTGEGYCYANMRCFIFIFQIIYFWCYIVILPNNLLIKDLNGRIVDYLYEINNKILCPLFYLFKKTVMVLNIFNFVTSFLKIYF